MKITQKIPYMLKRTVPSIMLLGATLLPGCKKEEQKHDVELNWCMRYYEEIRTENVQRYLDDPTVNNVYLKLINGGYFPVSGSINISNLHNSLSPIMELDPVRVRGRGNFVFIPGKCSEEDSLWFVAKGWTVNIQNQIPLQKQH